MSRLLSKNSSSELDFDQNPTGKWFYFKNEEKVGPFTLDELREKLKQGELAPHTAMKQEHSPDAEVTLNDLLHSSPTYSLIDALQVARDRRAGQGSNNSEHTAITTIIYRSPEANAEQAKVNQLKILIGAFVFLCFCTVGLIFFTWKVLPSAPSAEKNDTSSQLLQSSPPIQPTLPTRQINSVNTTLSPLNSRATGNPGFPKMDKPFPTFTPPAQIASPPALAPTNVSPPPPAVPLEDPLQPEPDPQIQQPEETLNPDFNPYTGQPSEVPTQPDAQPTFDP